MRSSSSIRCFGTAWIIGWAVAVFVPSAIIAYAAPSSAPDQPWSGFNGFLSATWNIADEVGPFAKIAFGAMFLALCAGIASFKIQAPFKILVLFCMAGIAAMLAALLLIPEAYSRGFGIGLTGARLDSSTLPYYIAGGMAAGAAFYFVQWSCTTKALKCGRNAA